MNKHLMLSPSVREALSQGKPVIALESTIISHGMPYPQNVETALACEALARENGAEPATVAVIGGRLCAGLTQDQIEYLGKRGTGITKASRRDLPLLVSRKQDGATTVAATMIIAALAGIKVFATGGVGGVHRGAETTMDISADLEELAMTPVAVVCAGVKSILDLGLTLEYLETKGYRSWVSRRMSCPPFTPVTAASRSMPGWTARGNRINDQCSAGSGLSRRDADHQPHPRPLRHAGNGHQQSH